MFNFRAWQLNIYTYLEWPSKNRLTDAQKARHTFSNKKNYTGELTEESLLRLRRSIRLLIAQAQPKIALNFKTNQEFTFRINFITLTLPSAQLNHTDKEIKRQVFDVWLKKAKRWFGLKSYVWRAERQKNENIHFHLLSDVYIDHVKLKQSWNQSLAQLDFIDRFENIHGHRYPNSTDVHSVRKVKDLAAYISKYMSKKGDKKNLIEGKVWGCSTNLNKLSKHTEIIDSRFDVEIRELCTRYKERVKNSDYASTIVFTENEINTTLPPNLSKVWNEYMQAVRNYQPKNEEVKEK